MLFKDPLNVAPVAKELKSTDDEVKKLREIVKKLQIRLLRFFFDFHGLVLSPITLSLRLFDG